MKNECSSLFGELEEADMHIAYICGLLDGLAIALGIWGGVTESWPLLVAAVVIFVATWFPAHYYDTAFRGARGTHE